ncbi:lysozyme inhibitor LprI family protein [Thioclava electrotropha]|uniref:DUF1311 domain-containing protein n=1 Tax=Thioclava electrotropha TaxID=1549850 RepID=A0ABX6YQC4_9RHOB|nr:lysozyme inhibitor LprI family protein [Thioclava electrotropha]QPZ90022.1 DUF1311 domain-containing protein [Thioclava electrotropha]
MKPFAATVLVVCCVPALSWASQSVDHIHIRKCVSQAEDQVEVCARKQVLGCMDTLENEGKAAVEYRSCSRAAFNQADSMLNEVYAVGISNVKAADMQREATNANYSGLEALLRKSQRAWIEVRDNTCELGVRYDATGSGAEMQMLLCQTELTMRRIVALEQQIGHSYPKIAR